MKVLAAAFEQADGTRFFKTTTRECDNLKPNVTYNGKCCSIGDVPCKEGRNGDKDKGNTPDPQPQ
ncbi:hypothetical protein [Mesorhizobium sp. AR10]|uniref:hypothetical protein n=1 Tax=Mesorhizobium sp. AR10 TaxID=2865839 RepID=UPI00215F5A9F|nr:hypothetical protein [Mesorhizobium sp. AR10]